ncbi:hypothetical protein NI17_022580 [Thermobifida halotolerans]|uniref:Uncharacterized protein n=1 Tax=Thermobifida halotolerans TaxID=483545 RepID=A0A399G0S5_9ACTN|nr:hypothetical protein [Thermobifida halotolerans]UOE19469.1 hypothetical protein NI17_022580 [Thermobifida halotolerans]
MSSSPLYLAIVAVWILVLVPMLLRRDAADPAADGLRRDPVEDGEAGDGPDGESEAAEATGEVPEDDAVAETDVEHSSHRSVTHTTRSEPPPVVTRPVRASRARIIARRRRRTSGLVLLLLATGVAVAVDLGPWWVLVPPAVLMAGHLALLREAARADAERRAAELARRRRRERTRARRAADAARQAEIVEITDRRNQVYDQYTDAQRRAAGD